MGSAKAHYDGIVAFSQTDFTEDLKSIEVPALVTHGEDNQIVPFADAGPLSTKLLKNSSTKFYSGFPHGMPTTMPSRSAPTCSLSSDAEARYFNHERQPSAEGAGGNGTAQNFCRIQEFRTEYMRLGPNHFLVAERSGAEQVHASRIVHIGSFALASLANMIQAFRTELFSGTSSWSARPDSAQRRDVRRRNIGNSGERTSDHRSKHLCGE